MMQAVRLLGDHHTCQQEEEDAFHDEDFRDEDFDQLEREYQ